MSELFHVLDDVFVILRTRNGVYRQAKVYHRGTSIYAGLGSGFVLLRATGTSNPQVSWEGLTKHRFITFNGPFRSPAFGG